MQNLEAYVDQKNRWNAIFGDSAMTFPLSEDAIKSIAQSIDAELSPENLHCDGEASPSAVRRKYAQLQSVLTELRTYCEDRAIDMPQMYEAY